jgi:hypothetical protein
MLNLVLIHTFAIYNSHIRVFLALIRNAYIDPHFEAWLLLAFLVKKNFDFIYSVGLLIIYVEMVKIIHFIHLCQVVCDD